MSRFYARYAPGTEDTIQEVEVDGIGRVIRILHQDLTPNKGVGFGNQWVFYPGDDSQNGSPLEHLDTFNGEADLWRRVRNRRTRQGRLQEPVQRTTLQGMGGLSRTRLNQSSFDVSGGEVWRSGSGRYGSQSNLVRGQSTQNLYSSTTAFAPMQPGRSMGRLFGSEQRETQTGDDDWRRGTASVQPRNAPVSENPDNWRRGPSSTSDRPLTSSATTSKYVPPGRRKQQSASAQVANPQPMQLLDSEILSSLRNWASSEESMLSFTSSIPHGRKSKETGDLVLCSGHVRQKILLIHDISSKSYHWSSIISFFARIGSILRDILDLDEKECGPQGHQSHLSFDLNKKIEGLNHFETQFAKPTGLELFDAVLRSALADSSRPISAILVQCSKDFSPHPLSMSAGEEIAINLAYDYVQSRVSEHMQLRMEATDKLNACGLLDFVPLLPNEKWLDESMATIFFDMYSWLSWPVIECGGIRVKGRNLEKVYVITSFLEEILNKTPRKCSLPHDITFGECLSSSDGDQLRRDITLLLCHHRNVIQTFFHECPKMSVTVCWVETVNYITAPRVAEKYAEKEKVDYEVAISLLHAGHVLLAKQQEKNLNVTCLNLEEFCVLDILCRWNLLHISTNGTVASSSVELLGKKMTLTTKPSALFHGFGVEVIKQLNTAYFRSKCQMGRRLTNYRWAMERTGESMTFLLEKDLYDVLWRQQKMNWNVEEELKKFEEGFVPSAPSVKSRYLDRQRFIKEDVDRKEQFILLITDFGGQVCYQITDLIGSVVEFESQVECPNKTVQLQKCAISHSTAPYLEAAIFRLIKAVPGHPTVCYIPTEYPVAGGILAYIITTGIKNFWQIPLRVLKWCLATNVNPSLEEIFQLGRAAFMSKGGFFAKALMEKPLASEDLTLEWDCLLDPAVSRAFKCAYLSTYCTRKRLDLSRCIKDKWYRNCLKPLLQCSVTRVKQIDAVMERLGKIPNILPTIVDLDDKTTIMRACGFSDSEIEVFSSLFTFEDYAMSFDSQEEFNKLLSENEKAQLQTMDASEDFDVYVDARCEAPSSVRKSERIQFGSSLHLQLPHLYSFDHFFVIHFLTAHMPPHVLLEPLIPFLDEDLYKDVRKYVVEKATVKLDMDLISNHQLVMSVIKLFGKRGVWNSLVTITPWITGEKTVTCLEWPLMSPSNKPCSDVCSCLIQSCFMTCANNNRLSARPISIRIYQAEETKKKDIAERLQKLNVDDPKSKLFMIKVARDRRLAGIRYPDVQPAFNERIRRRELRIRTGQMPLSGWMCGHMDDKENFDFSN